MRTTIVIFANSVKHRKHCVAGKVVDTKSWIRPVSDPSGAELSNTQCLLTNPHGKFKVKPLQKVEMNFAQHAPLIHQPENHVISGETWQQRYTIETSELGNYLDTPDTLWGVGNRVSFAQIEAKLVNIEQSLYLVQADELQLSKATDGKRRASFSYAGNSYDLPVTDPNFDQLLAEPKYQQILCVSLGEKYASAGDDNFSCYKIVATIL